MPSSLAHVLERADHRIDHAAGQKIDGGFAVELIARAALDQSRSKTALYRGDDGRPAGLRPYQSQFRLGAFSDHLPIQHDSPSVVRQRAILRALARHLASD